MPVAGAEKAAEPVTGQCKRYDRPTEQQPEKQHGLVPAQPPAQCAAAGLQGIIQPERRVADEQKAEDDNRGHEPIPVVTVREGGGHEEREGITVKKV